MRKIKLIFSLLVSLGVSTAAYGNDFNGTFVSVVNSLERDFVRQLHLYSRLNFKLSRAAALTEWRQLLSA